VSGIKLLVSDVDGTLVDKEKKVTPATVDAVTRLKAAGLGFTIISARPRSGMSCSASTNRWVRSMVGSFSSATVP
jgi:hydroxymethylpyrimidine pyrophosphatase-like HAD family hydrolase